MSQSTVELNGLSSSFAEAMFPLLKEYTGKLNDVCRQARELRAEKPSLPLPFKARHLLQSEHEQMAEWLNSIRPAATGLARHASQMAEHGKLNELTRAELKLRLADFEFALRAAEASVNSPQP